ncbi:hypothetical protein [Borrelia venezuelensis]|uniref:hypothetical protein n=1 Tax=Borrelia venezuelensis TaxID=1653839 RepID=UPI001FF11740|nr:hypothetical protein [Borrelia venezuelensis]UPA12571.1 hypothetical protein bvRMA01_000888 [Borrelia venezuelensis]
MEIELEVGWFGGRANVARMHEIGANNLPVRKHLSEVAASSKFREYISNDYIKNEFARDPRSGMSAIGDAFITYYQNYVLSGKINPELSPNTIKQKRKKGSINPEIPLVDTSQMLNEISYKVT